MSGLLVRETDRERVHSDGKIGCVFGLDRSTLSVIVEPERRREWRVKERSGGG